MHARMHAYVCAHGLRSRRWPFDACLCLVMHGPDESPRTACTFSRCGGGGAQTACSHVRHACMAFIGFQGLGGHDMVDTLDCVVLDLRQVVRATAVNRRVRSKLETCVVLRVRVAERALSMPLLQPCTPAGMARLALHPYAGAGTRPRGGFACIPVCV